MHYQKIIDNSFCLRFFNGTESRQDKEVRKVSHMSNFSFFSYKVQPNPRGARAKSCQLGCNFHTNHTASTKDRNSVLSALADQQQSGR